MEPSSSKLKTIKWFWIIHPNISSSFMISSILYSMVVWKPAKVVLVH